MICVIGHPFSDLGTGEHCRSTLRCLKSCRIGYEVIDVYRHSSRDDIDYRSLVIDHEVRHCSMPVRLFHINADEIEAVLAILEADNFDLKNGFNIIIPAWELSTCPEGWVNRLRVFDEIWAISRFNYDCFLKENLPVCHISEAVEQDLEVFLPRRYFGLNEQSVVLLNFFDYSSFVGRKNPEGIIALFQQLCIKLPFVDLQLVLKVKGNHGNSHRLSSYRDTDKQVRIFETRMSSFEVRSLISACDIFVSLHRSEGFGRGPAEAMMLGRVAAATAWSGNLDYMTPQNSVLVDFDLVDVPMGAYPHSKGQRWAEPRIDDAVDKLLPLCTDRSKLNELAARGKRDIMLSCSNEVVGMRMVERLSKIDISRLAGHSL